MVALRKESVDRNSIGAANLTVPTTSLSARRAWIEIRRRTYQPNAKRSLSARRAWIEITYVTRLPRAQVSLSARRAWIEIKLQRSIDIISQVALRKESVDRNYIIKITEIWGAGRSPQGERG